MSENRLGTDHEELMEFLTSVDGVKEHLESFSVKIGRTILKRRLDLGISQKDLAELIKQNGGTITQSTISHIESGDRSIQSETYDKVFEALGFQSLDARFFNNEHVAV